MSVLCIVELGNKPLNLLRSMRLRPSSREGERTAPFPRVSLSTLTDKLNAKAA